MDLRLVEIFCRVYEERSFSRAARVLDLTQPTISTHIKDFEAALGTPLFNRLGREIQPTEAGTFLYRHAKSILSFKRTLVTRMEQFLNRIEGDLVVGASSVPGEYLLPGLLVGFRARHPGVLPRLRISDTVATLEDLRRGDIPLGVVGNTVDDGDLVFQRFAADALVLAAPATGPLAAARSVSVKQLG
jgi:DNA-binding transcriptional LysR family regulator